MPHDPSPRPSAGQDPGSASGPGLGPGAVRYAETLRVPLRWWALATSFEAAVLVAFAVAVPLWVALLTTAALVLLSTTWFLTYGSARLEVTDQVFRAGRAQIEVRWLADPRPLDGEETWRAAGPGADARAWLVLRPYLRESVMVQVVDPADPVPYWLVSTRRPGELAASLGAVVSGVSGEGHRAE